MGTIKIPIEYHMVSSDVKSLFTNVPLEYTIDLVLERIYYNGELSADISRSEMKEMVTICSKNVHFTFNDDNDDTTSFHLGPVFTGIFMVLLKRSLVRSVLKDQLSFWKRSVGVVITFIKTGSIEYILSILNGFYPNIEFTFETEFNSESVFLDVLSLREGQNIIITFYRKVTISGIYLN